MLSPTSGLVFFYLDGLVREIIDPEYEQYMHFRDNVSLCDYFYFSSLAYLVGKISINI